MLFRSALHLSVGDLNSMLRYCTILRGSLPDFTGLVYKLQAARALHISVEHLAVSDVSEREDIKIKYAVDVLLSHILAITLYLNYLVLSSYILLLASAVIVSIILY